MVPEFAADSQMFHAANSGGAADAVVEFTMQHVTFKMVPEFAADSQLFHAANSSGVADAAAQFTMQHL